MKKILLLLAIFICSSNRAWQLSNRIQIGQSISINKDICLENEIAVYVNYILNKYNRKLPETKKAKIIKALYIGQLEYDVAYQDVVTIILVETKFKNVRSRRNSNGTYDYGFCQINEVNLSTLYKKSSAVLSRYGIAYDDSNKLDTSLNVMSAILHIYYLQNRTKNDDWVIAYNRGINGYKRVDKKDCDYYNKYKNYLIANN